MNGRRTMAYSMIVAMAAVAVAGSAAGAAHAQEGGTIPGWIKSIFEFYVDGQITDAELISALEFLIAQDIIQVTTATGQDAAAEMVTPEPMRAPTPARASADAWEAPTARAKAEAAVAESSARAAAEAAALVEEARGAAWAAAAASDNGHRAAKTAESIAVATAANAIASGPSTDAVTIIGNIEPHQHSYRAAAISSSTPTIREAYDAVVKAGEAATTAIEIAWSGNEGATREAANAAREAANAAREAHNAAAREAATARDDAQAAAQHAADARDDAFTAYNAVRRAAAEAGANSDTDAISAEALNAYRDAARAADAAAVDAARAADAAAFLDR